MVNNSIVSVESALVALVTGVGTIQQVATGRTTDISGGFPFCRVYFDGMGGSWEDQQSFYATYVFQLDIVQELAAKSRAQAETDLQTAAYAVLRALVTGWQLSNHADDTTIQLSPAREVEIPQGPAVLMQVTLNVRSLIY